MSEEVFTAEDVRRIRVEWRVEAEDRINAATIILGRMQSQSPDESHMKELMRALHSLKGTAAMVGFRDISEYTHQMEEYCDMFRGQNAVPLSHLSVDLLDSAMATLNTAVEVMNPDQDPKVEDTKALNAIKTALNQLHAERVLHFTEPDLPQRAPDPVKWPVIKALDQMQNMNAVCESCPFIRSGWPSLSRKIMDPQDIQNQLDSLNKLTIEPCVLVIDDETDVTLVVGDLIRSILPRARIIEADSGTKALNLLKSVMGDQIDLVVTDLVMPEIGGLDVLRCIQQLKSRGELFANTMVMTAYKPMERDWRDCLQFGVRDFLVKPFGVQEMLNSLLAPIREAMMNRLLSNIVSYSQRVYLGFNRMEREDDQQVQHGIKREVHNLMMLLAKAQKNLADAQVLPLS